MMKRLTLPVLFLVFGFVGGLVLTGRLRTAEEASAQAAPPALTQGKPTAEHAECRGDSRRHA